MPIIKKMKRLRPFMSYYGSKWRLAPHYPSPMYDTIIEPFAGGAGYATNYHSKKILLYDVNPKVIAVWQYLIRTSSEELLRIPIVDSMEELDVCEEAKWFVGFWLAKGIAEPRKNRSVWGIESLENGVDNVWSEGVRTRIASQLKYIRHWKAYNLPYIATPDIEATWFIDPPYANDAGEFYPYKFHNYLGLSSWCQSRKGQMIVCENEGAAWLPFKYLCEAKSTNGKGRLSHQTEVVWVGQDRELAKKLLTNRQPSLWE